MAEIMQEYHTPSTTISWSSTSSMTNYFPPQLVHVAWEQLGPVLVNSLPPIITSTWRSNKASPTAPSLQPRGIPEGLVINTGSTEEYVWTTPTALIETTSTTTQWPSAVTSFNSPPYNSNNDNVKRGDPCDEPPEPTPEFDMDTFFKSDIRSPSGSPHDDDRVMAGSQVIYEPIRYKRSVVQDSPSATITPVVTGVNSLVERGDKSAPTDFWSFIGYKVPESATACKSKAKRSPVPTITSSSSSLSSSASTATQGVLSKEIEKFPVLPKEFFSSHSKVGQVWSTVNVPMIPREEMPLEPGFDRRFINSDPVTPTLSLPTGRSKSRHWPAALTARSSVMLVQKAWTNDENTLRIPVPTTYFEYRKRSMSTPTPVSRPHIEVHTTVVVDYPPPRLLGADELTQPPHQRRWVNGTNETHTDNGVNMVVSVNLDAITSDGNGTNITHTVHDVNLTRYDNGVVINHVDQSSINATYHIDDTFSIVIPGKTKTYDGEGYLYIRDNNTYKIYHPKNSSMVNHPGLQKHPKIHPSLANVTNVTATDNLTINATTHMPLRRGPDYNKGWTVTVDGKGFRYLQNQGKWTVLDPRDQIFNISNPAFDMVLKHVIWDPKVGDTIHHFFHPSNTTNSSTEDPSHETLLNSAMANNTGDVSNNAINTTFINNLASSKTHDSDTDTTTTTTAHLNARDLDSNTQQHPILPPPPPASETLISAVIIEPEPTPTEGMTDFTTFVLVTLIFAVGFFISYTAYVVIRFFVIRNREMRRHFGRSPAAAATTSTSTRRGHGGVPVDEEQGRSSDSSSSMRTLMPEGFAVDDGKENGARERVEALRGELKV